MPDGISSVGGVIGVPAMLNAGTLSRSGKPQAEVGAAGASMGVSQAGAWCGASGAASSAMILPMEGIA